MTRSIYNNYAVILHGNDGKDYSLLWNGGPGGTDSSEWSDNNGLGILFSLDGALNVVENPNAGYRPTPDGVIKVYKIVLEEVENLISPNEAKNLLNRARIALELMSPVIAKEDPIPVLDEYLLILTESLDRLKSNPLAYNEGLALKEKYTAALKYYLNNKE